MQLEITSKDNRNIKEITKLLSLRKYRYDTNMFVIEGLRLCMDACESGVKIDTLFYTNEFKLRHDDELFKLMQHSSKSYVVAESVMSSISDTKSPQGIICICPMLDKYITLDKIDINGKYVAFENLQDPSNLGTILRTMEALGFNEVILSRDCCDIYNPKVLRGSMGAIFRLKFLICDDIKADICALNKRGFRSFACVVGGAAHYITDIEFKNGDIALIGNEANGLTDEIINLCTERITIPMNGKAESLNASAAANIIMWEMMRK